MRAHIRDTRRLLLQGLTPEALARLYPPHSSVEVE